MSANEQQWQADDQADSYWDEDDYVPCSWCGGDGWTECDDPIQCCDSRCDGEIDPCTACDGRGHSQVVW